MPVKKRAIMVGVAGQNHKAKAISTRQTAINKIQCIFDLKLLSKVWVQIECKINGKEKAKISNRVMMILK